MTDATQSPLPEPGLLARSLSVLSGNRTGVIGFVLVALIVGSAILAPWIVPYDPTAIMTGPRMAPPSAEHWLGTDNIGRDIFSRVIAGGRIAMLVAAASLTAALSAGLLLGLIAGLGPRWLDNLLLLVFDALRSFPTIVFGLAVVTIIGPSLFTVMLVVAITSVPIYARIVRTQTLALKNAEFILAERAMGVGLPRLLFVHVLPNVLGPLLILASMDVPLVIATEAGLSFLGMGVRPPTPSWGVILNDGYNFIRNSPWPVIGGSIPIILVTLGFTFMGEALRDIFDPKLRKAG
ncbi:ABC transporter permease [Alloyangia pacifica]|uniref:Peptide/nickel transport system permease protein n=1 Tax=Alloyangia pacifica TaxID=311180 RepID=A0A1I6UP38_9RHOB|nr:ABC transporter permease [Alloyangia pacifica]SDH77048.1 peptide/nickel transport system permease protein [Alloyangia pacifica]SFT03209.1 peptide/nickel transport system permease protein [Alloyangia pacifica]